MPFGFDDAMMVMSAANLAGGLFGSETAKDAGQIQADAANRATDMQKQMFDTVRGDQSPYRKSGAAAQKLLGGYLGLPGYTVPGKGTYKLGSGQSFSNEGDLRSFLESDYLEKSGGLSPAQDPVQHSIDDIVKQAQFTADPGQKDDLTGSLVKPFGPDDLKAGLAPNYDFMLGQGIGATKNALNLQGGMGGNTLKGVVDYATNFAGNAYQQAYNNYTTNQNNIFNRLQSIAGLGQTAGSASATGANAFATGMANTMQGAGQAQASGMVGGQNALTSGLQNAGSWYSLPQLLNYGKGGGGFLNDAGRFASL